jgi:hypothetical protein
MIQTFYKPQKAILTATISTAEVHEDAEGIEEVSTFKKGTEVYVLGVAHKNSHGLMYVIYSAEAREATTIIETFLKFIEGEN